MKKLLHKLFYLNTSAEDAVFALALFWLGSWCLGTAFIFSNGLTACFVEFFSMSRNVEQPFVGQYLLLLAEVGVLLHYLIVTGLFYCTMLRGKWLRGIWFIAPAVLLGAIVMLSPSRNGFWFMIYLYVIFCWAVPLVVLPNQWKLLIPAGFAPALIALPYIVIFVILYATADVFSSTYLPPPGILRTTALLFASPWFAVLSTLLGILCCFCRCKAFANATGKPFRAMFGKGAATLGAVFLLTYGMSLGMAYFAHCRTERHVAELEKFFGRPVNVQGMMELYYQGRKPDAAFWKRVLDFRFDFAPDYVSAPNVELSPAKFAELKKVLESSSKLCELETMFDTEPPAFERDFQRGGFTGIRLPEYNHLRQLVRCEAWRVRFAIADRNAAAALAALNRMVKIRDYLARDPEMAIPSLVMIFVEDLRLDSLERLLSAELLSDPELTRQRKLLSEHRKQMAGIHARAVYGEAVVAMDFCDLFVYGRESDDKDDLIPAFYGYRWLFPAGWYVLTGIRDCYAVNYRVSDFTRIPYKIKNVREDSTAHYIAGHMLLCSRIVIGNRFHSLTARYLAMETLIGIELEKRRTGKYPEKLDDPPLDPFGHPLLYKHGRVPFIPVVWDEESRMGKPTAPVTVDGIAVWSRGADRVDDGGLTRSGQPDKLSDDVRALKKLPSGK